MGYLSQAADQAKALTRLPSRAVTTYSDWVLGNAAAVGQVEGGLRSLSYIIPGGSHSFAATESLNTGVQLLSLYHDSLLSRATAQKPQRKQHQSPHNRYTKFYCQKSKTYKRMAVTLQVIQYTELLLEMMAKRQGEKAKWRAVVVLEAVKAMCRLVLMRLTNSRPLLSPPLPERDVVPEQPAQDEEMIPSPPSERSEAGSEQWTMPRTSLTLPPLPSSEDISTYLLSKVLTADDIKPPKALLHRVSGVGSAAEVMYILRPVIYAAAMAYYCQNHSNGRGKADWRPWLLGLSIEYGARSLAQRDLESRRPGGARGLTQLEKEEMKKRGWALGWWGMRGAFYENVTRVVVKGVAKKLKGKPLLDMVGNIIEDYDFLWDDYYFPTATICPGQPDLEPHPPVIPQPGFTLDFSIPPFFDQGCLYPGASDRAAIIQSFGRSSSTRKPADVPLHTLYPSSSSKARRSSEESYDEKDSRQRLRRSGSFDDDSEGGSEFSLWSDTGDLVDQLAEEEDPLAIRLRRSFEADHNTRRGRKKQKRVRYADDEDEKPSTARPGVVTRKEEIIIPNPAPKPISWGHRTLAAVIMPGDSHSRMHGLHGKKLVFFLTIFVSLGVFLFGYDQGVMSGIITGPYFKDYFNQPSRAEIGTMVAILEVGALIASLAVGRIGDIIGRRKTILYGAMIFVVGGTCQSFATGMSMMMLGRFVAGLGVGALSTIVPIYQSEISPPHNRGLLACMEFSGNIFGYMVSVWVDYGCSFIYSDWAWRLPLLLQVVMGSLLVVGSFLIVESPRWLLDNDHDEEGIVVIANLYGKGDIHNPKARDEYREIKMNVLLQRQEGERSYTDMFRRYYKRVFIAMSAQALAQLNGINVISYYAPLVFEQAGWVGRDAILMTGINSITYLASTVPPWYLVDRLGRRFILLSGAVAMIISLSAISYFIYIDIRLTPTLVVAFVMIYNASFGYSWGPIPWLYPPEILPLSIRAKGASLSTAANWAFNWLVGEMTPILQDLIKWRLYLVHAFFCAVSFVVVWFIYPETANVRLEDMNSIFGDATTIAPTPEQIAEADSIFSGNRSPVPSFRLGADDEEIPDNIDDLHVPDVEIKDGKPVYGDGKDGNGEGVSGWISNMVKRTKGEEPNGSGSGKYKKVGQDEEED
ncbi:Ribulose bisphosphate carboxylase large chain [Elasticomyces elasticus]|uniref:Ribulose bisphosphate carboxylase large chain n=1 Tax=Elasticomyces elasticus TaxID=574655 RepID=A0AAN7WF00_9PEZI|nr:Ribulose bisphosphate carboxylase large chain [Elasticomyces elasticus]